MPGGIPHLLHLMWVDHGTGGESVMPPQQRKSMAARARQL